MTLFILTSDWIEVMIMYPPHLFLLFIAINIVNLTFAANLNLQKLYEDAEAQMDEKLKLEMIAGSRSSRFNKKKFTD